jgi:hypothetical protein
MGWPRDRASSMNTISIQQGEGDRREAIVLGRRSIETTDES